MPIGYTVDCKMKRYLLLIAFLSVACDSSKDRVMPQAAEEGATEDRLMSETLELRPQGAPVEDDGHGYSPRAWTGVLPCPLFRTLCEPGAIDAAFFLRGVAPALHRPRDA